MDRLTETNEWIKYATDDLEVVNILTTHYPPKLEIICYHCQQSVEKMLKAFLVYSNVRPPKKHELDILCDMCEYVDKSFTDIYAICDRLNPYSNLPRYPLGLELTEDMMKLAVKDSEQIYEFVKSKIGKESAEVLEKA